MTITSASTLHELLAPVREHLLPILEETLDLCAERHALAEGQGADGFSFGTDAWSLPARAFRERAGERAFPFDVVQGDGCVLDYDGVRIRHHRVGETGHDDIAVSFPRNAKAAGREASRQIPLPLGFERSLDPIADSTVALAYMANPSDGLCAVYLATIGQVCEGKITAWEATVEVWRRSDTLPLAQVASMVAPAETAAPPVVRRGPRKAKGHGRR